MNNDSFLWFTLTLLNMFRVLDYHHHTTAFSVSQTIQLE